MDLALPLFQPQPAPEPQQIKTQSMGGLLPGRLAGVADMLPVPRFASSNLLSGQSLRTLSVCCMLRPFVDLLDLL